MIFMGVFFTMDGFRHLASGTLSRRGASVRVTESTFASISGLILGSAKYFFGHKMKSFVVVADSLTCFCAGITSLVSLVVLAFRSAHWAQQSARFCAAIFTVYCGVMVIGHANNSMDVLKSHENARRSKVLSEKEEEAVYDSAEMEDESDDFAFLFNYGLMISTFETLYHYPVEFFYGKSRSEYTSVPTDENSNSNGEEGSCETSFQSDSFVAK